MPQSEWDRLLEEIHLLISKGFSTESISDYVDEIYNNNNEGEIK